MACAEAVSQCTAVREVSGALVGTAVRLAAERCGGTSERGAAQSAVPRLRAVGAHLTGSPDQAEAQAEAQAEVEFVNA